MAEGTWNDEHTEYYYHGLHYTASDRTVRFRVKDLKAGGVVRVGIITKTPTIDDPETQEVETRRDFYNFASAVEGALRVISNTVHVYMGDENATLYNVTYSYTGELPENNIPDLPTGGSYVKNASVSIAPPVKIEGYEFSGWTGKTETSNEDVQLDENGSFKMPNENIIFTGSFTKLNNKHSVIYQIDGDMPEGYVVPLAKEYFEEANVTIDSLKAGDKFGAYTFSGWTTQDVEIIEDEESGNKEFLMGNSNVTFKGSFTLTTYKVEYKFYDTVLPPDSESYLPETVSYLPGTTVITATKESVTNPTGYEFLGWYKEDSFIMPEEDVVIYGEWRQIYGEFEVQISKEVVNEQIAYRVGDEVKFKISVTNPNNFDLTDVIVKENYTKVIDGIEKQNDTKAKFIEGEGYKKESDDFATIENLPANSTVDVYAVYTVTEEDERAGTIAVATNEAEIVGALDKVNHYTLKEEIYKATANFNVITSFRITADVTKHDEQRTNTVTNQKETVQLAGGRITNNYNTKIADGEYKVFFEYIDENADSEISSVEVTPNSGYIIKKITFVSCNKDGSDSETTVLYGENETLNSEIKYTYNQDGSVTIMPVQEGQTSLFKNVTKDKNIIAEFEAQKGTVTVYHMINSQVLEEPATEYSKTETEDLVGEPYKTEPLSIYGYKLVSTSNNIEGQYPAGEIVNGNYVEANTDVYYYYGIDENQTKILSYTVEYYKEGVKVNSDTQTERATVQVLQPDTLSVDKTKINTIDKYYGYKLEKTEPETIPDVVNNGDVLKVYYIVDENQTKEISYTVEYYKDGIKVEEDTQVETETVQVLVNSINVKRENINIVDKYEEYAFDSERTGVIPTTATNGTIIKIYYIDTLEKHKITTEIEENLAGLRTGGTITGEYTQEYPSSGNIKLVEIVRDTKNATQDIEIIPDSGYHILEILVNGEKYEYTVNGNGRVIISKTYFENVTKDYHISVMFGENQKRIKLVKTGEVDSLLQGAKFSISSVSTEEISFGELTNYKNQLNLIDDMTKVNQSYYFAKQSDGTYRSNNSARGTTAISRIPIDLRKYQGECTLIVNVSKSSNYYYGYAKITESLATPAFSTGDCLIKLKESGTRSYTTKLTGGKIYYLYFAYVRTGTYYGTFTINSVRLNIPIYSFESEDGVYVSNNVGQNNTLASSYMTLDLRNYLGKYNLNVNAEIDAEPEDYGFVAIKNDSDIIYDITKERKAIYMTESENTKQESITIYGGKLYYIYLGYYNGSTDTTKTDKFKVNSIRVQSDNITNQNGELYVDLPDTGIYYIKELEAPENYELLTSPYQFELNETDTNKIVTIQNQRSGYKITTEIAENNQGNRAGGTITGEYTEDYPEENNIKYVETIKKTQNAVNDIIITPDMEFVIEEIKINGNNYEFEPDTEGKVIISKSNFTEVDKDYHIIVKFKYIRNDLSYTVHYKEQGTNLAVANDKVVDNQTFGAQVTESAIDVEGYEKVAPTSTNIEITAGTNEYTFYYTKRTDLSYTVHYKEQGTNLAVANDKVVNNQTFGTQVTENAIDVEGYIQLSPTTQVIEIAVEENEITFYYAKREDLSYIVKY